MFLSKNLRISPEVSRFMIGSGCSGFGRTKPPTNPKASGFVGDDPQLTVRVSVWMIFSSGSGGLVGLVGYMSWVDSPTYRPQMNGAVEAANKSIKKILVKMTNTYKDWHEYLLFALCTYHTSVHTFIDATPYSSIFGMKVVLLVEVKIPSLRILSQTELSKAEWAHSRYEQLKMIDEKCMIATCHG